MVGYIHLFITYRINLFMDSINFNISINIFIYNSINKWTIRCLHDLTNGEYHKSLFVYIINGYVYINIRLGVFMIWQMESITKIYLFILL